MSFARLVLAADFFSSLLASRYSSLVDSIASMNFFCAIGILISEASDSVDG